MKRMASRCDQKLDMLRFSQRTVVVPMVAAMEETQRLIVTRVSTAGKSG